MSGGPYRGALRRAAGLAALYLLVVAWIHPARAEKLVSSLSSHRVLITSNFNGEELVLFGTVEPDADVSLRKSGYDIVVTITGPRQSVVTFHKQRMFGIWMNTDSREYVDAPSYFGVLSTRDIGQFADTAMRRRLQLGSDFTPLSQVRPTDNPDVRLGDPFRDALLRIKKQHGLYIDQPAGVTFLAPSLFRASIPLPAEAPIGTYEVDIKLFYSGAMIARTNSAFEIVKVGFERFVATSAVDHGLLYGLVAAMMAMMTGWLASVVFRRD